MAKGIEIIHIHIERKILPSPTTINHVKCPPCDAEGEAKKTIDADQILY